MYWKTRRIFYQNSLKKNSKCPLYVSAAGPNWFPSGNKKNVWLSLVEWSRGIDIFCLVANGCTEISSKFSTNIQKINAALVDFFARLMKLVFVNRSSVNDHNFQVFCFDVYDNK